MTGIDFDDKKIISYWLTEANEAVDVATHLLEKEDYSYALFFGHLAIEKMLKGLFVSRHKKHDHRFTIWYGWQICVKFILMKTDRTIAHHYVI